MTPPRVLVVGDVMRDIVVRPAGPLRLGTDQRASIRTLAGGAGANQAAWLAYRRVPVRLLAGVAAADRAAQEARFAALDIEPMLVGHPVLPTGQVIAVIDADGERSFYTDRGANDAIALEHLPSGVLDGVTHLHVSGYALVGSATRDSVRHLVTAAKARGSSISLDPGSVGFIAEVGPALFADVLGPIDLCVATEEEAGALAGGADGSPAAAIQALATWSALVLIKRGALGAQAFGRDGLLCDRAAPAVTVVDTIGAGDAFLAGFLAAWLAGVTLSDALDKAVAAGAEAVSIEGGQPPVSKTHRRTFASA